MYMPSASLLVSALSMVRKQGSPICFLCLVYHPSSAPDLNMLPMLGDSFNSALVAIVSVDQDALKAWAASEGIQVTFSWLSVS